jgi:hypothetical protein
MAKLRAVDCAEQKHRNALAEAFLERRRRVDVDLCNAGARGRGERSKRRAHFIAQMTVRADEERELSHAAGPRTVHSLLGLIAIPRDSMHNASASRADSRLPSTPRRGGPRRPLAAPPH